MAKLITSGMRAVIAMMQHETNTFSPVPTPFSRFGTNGIDVPCGNDALKSFDGTGTGFGAFVDIARSADMELATPIAGNAAPSGPVESEAYSAMTDAICESISKGCDVCFLDLHGAMVTESLTDGEGELLRRIRSIAPDLPIAISLDLHANLTEAMVENCDIMVGYKTYPHIDMYGAGEHSGRLMLRMLNSEIDPVMTWGNIPLLAQTLRMGHSDIPMGPLIDAARNYEKEGLLAASIFGGFPLADISEAGMSAVTISNGNLQRANDARDALLESAWNYRHEFIFDSLPIEETIDGVKNLNGSPILLLDHADNSASGGTQDTTAALAAVINSNLEDVAVFAICDPVAVAEMTAVGVGNEITVSLGGKTDMPSISHRGEPLVLSGKVHSLTDGSFQITAEMGKGTWAAMGPSAVLDLGKIKIAVISRHTEPFDLGHLQSLGIEPTQCRFILLKSRIHYRAGFRAVAAHEIPISGIGVTSSDNSLFDFKNVRRPIFPLDQI
ncbi:MAG: M81 family metallopeptidase [Actinomycetota bacterium]|nr:M81 family metallopeptidase [Actinomycetota bacterium]MDG2120649.1 M81 family metallopeptidase [Actinomycetota bacterium]